jgi:hypothetical protein
VSEIIPGPSLKIVERLGKTVSVKQAFCHRLSAYLRVASREDIRKVATNNHLPFTPDKGWSSKCLGTELLTIHPKITVNQIS